MAKIIIVEDDPLIAKSVKSWLESERHTVEVVADGEDGLFRLQYYQYDLAILDWQLPRKSGPEICSALRSANKDIPVLMLTARSSVGEKIQGLDCGAHDYLVKPASLEELSARVRALLRRSGGESPPAVSFGNLNLDHTAHDVSANGNKARLSPNEFLILAFLCKNMGEYFSADSLIQRLWTGNTNVSSPLIKVHITHLRKKLASIESDVQILSERRGGYSAALSSSGEIQNNPQ